MNTAYSNESNQYNQLNQSAPSNLSNYFHHSAYSTEYDIMKYKLASTAMGIAHWDLEIYGGNLLNPANKFTWSPELRDMLGYDADGDYVDSLASWFAHIHPDDRKTAREEYVNSMVDRTGKTVFDHEFRIRKTNGEYIYIRGLGTALRDGQGTPLRVAGAVTNITKERETRIRLREAEERAAMMLDSTPIPIIMWDKAGNIIDCSKSAIETFGFETKQEVLDNLMSLAPEYQPCGLTSEEVLFKKVKETIETGDVRLEWTHRTKGGDTIIFDAIARRVMYKGDYAILLYPRDIRAEKKTREELAQREKTLDTLNRTALSLLSREEKSFAKAMKKGLDMISQIADIDRMSVFRNTEKESGRHLTQLYRWRKDANGTVDVWDELKDIPYSAVSTQYEQILMSGECLMTSVSELAENDVFRRFGCVTILAVPIFDGAKFWGVTLFERLVEENFTEREVEALRSASFMLANAVMRNEEAEAIRQANDRVQRMLDAIPLSITMWDKDWNFIDSSQYAVDLFGYSSKQELGKELTKGVPEYQPSSGRRSLDILNEAASEAFIKGDSSSKWTQLSKSGEEVQLDTKVIRVEHNGDYAVMLCSRDIREESRMLAELHARDEMLAAQAHWYMSILDGVPVPISVMDTDMKLTFTNRAAKSIFGRPREEIIGQPCSIWNCANCGTDECPIVRAKRGQPRTLLKDNGVSYKADTEILRDGGGETVGYLEILQDVTEVENLARRSADAANEAKNAFLAQMSHEMRTPLSAVIGLSELVLENDALSRENEVYLDKIYNAGSTLLSIVNDILDISKIEAGKFDIIPQEYDVPSLINDTITQNILRIHSKPVHFSLNISDNVPAKLYGDDIRVKQVVSNLLSNAFKYTDEGEVELSIDFERDGDYVWTTFRISDTGIGIRQEDIGRVFSDYTRFDGESNRKVGGTGLGLSITKRLTELMDGSVSVESDYGKGSVFTAEIRQKHVNDTVIGAEMAEHLRNFGYTTSKRRSGAQLDRVRLPYARVLIVDDNMTNLDIAQGLMRPYGMEIDCVTSGQEAIKYILDADRKYSAVFMDHMMPGMDGVEAVRIIRNEIGSEYARTVPIIALTANAVAGNQEHFIRQGFNAFVSKPIDIFRLDSVIRKWIWDKEKEREYLEKPRVFVERRKRVERRSGGDRRSGVGRRRRGDSGAVGGSGGVFDTVDSYAGQIWDAGGAGQIWDAGGAGHAGQSGQAGNADPRFAGEKIAGLDWARGLEIFGSEESYRQVLRSFAVNTGPLLEKIADTDEASLSEYTIRVHGIKSSGRGICAGMLGAMAESLEFAGKDGNIEFVKTHNPDFLRTAYTLIDDINATLDDTRAGGSKPEKECPDADVLTRLKSACEDYDMDGIESCAREIGTFRYTADDGLAAWLCENVEKLNYALIAERLS